MENITGKKKARKRPGCHLKQNKRVAAREKMMAERVAASELGAIAAESVWSSRGFENL